MTTAQMQALPIRMDPDILGGTPVFAGTRVPVRTVFDYLADGCSLEDFLENFPSVSRTNAVAVLEAGWSGIKNGELLGLAESRFEVFLTADQNLRHQQNLAQRTIAIIELPTNTLSVVKSQVPEIQSVILQ